VNALLTSLLFGATIVPIGTEPEGVYIGVPFQFQSPDLDETWNELQTVSETEETAHITDGSVGYRFESEEPVDLEISVYNAHDWLRHYFSSDGDITLENSVLTFTGPDTVESLEGLRNEHGLLQQPTLALTVEGATYADWTLIEYYAFPIVPTKAAVKFEQVELVPEPGGLSVAMFLVIMLGVGAALVRYGG